MRLALALGLVFAFAAPAAAHMVVLPATSEAGGWERYSLLVPTEKDVATVRIELKLPNGMEVVAIEAKPGWEGAYHPFPLGAATLRWTGGRIPPEQMMSFDFMAWNPPAPRTVSWDATQWYEDGSSDHWSATGDPERNASTTVLQPGAAGGAGGVGGGSHRHAEGPRAPAAAGEGRRGEGARGEGAHGEAAHEDAAHGDAAREDARGSAGPSLAVSLALSSLALSLTALIVAATARRRPEGG